jgi:MYXO-CTERM domain-containing protein
MKLKSLRLVLVGLWLCWAPQAMAADNDGDGYDSTVDDCNDANSSIHPGAANNTYGVDSDCDGSLTCYRDLDGDTYGSTTLIEAPDMDANCNEPADFTANDGLDCNDNNNNINPGASNNAYGVDSDCDLNVTCYRDLDQDGYGTGAVLVEETDSDGNCDEPSQGTANDALDCNDTSIPTYPGAPATVYGADNDCDGQVNCYADTDGDGFGSATLVDSTDGDANCDEPLDGHSSNASDCNDGNSAINQSAALTIYGVDNDCSGNFACYTDADGDGYGTATLVRETDFDSNCDNPSDFTADDDTDCNDGNASVNPGATEICNGLNDDCDNGTSEFAVCPNDGGVDAGTDAGTDAAPGSVEAGVTPDSGAAEPDAATGVEPSDAATGNEPSEAGVGGAGGSPTNTGGDGNDDAGSITAGSNGADASTIAAEAASDGCDCSVPGQHSSRNHLPLLLGLVALVGIRRGRRAS